jgi:arylamine N-acetyltransferase
MDDNLLDTYLRRIGAARPERADAAGLRDLQLCHLRTVPFENLSIHLGEDIVLEEKPLLAKVVEARRGGFCYELNSTFAALLRGLGFTVSLLQARLFAGRDRIGIPYDHLALRVDTADSGPWLADVGFGDHSYYPLALDERGDQRDPAGTFRIAEGPEQGDLDLYRNGKPEFRLEARPCALADFRAGAWWHSTNPTSNFRRSLVCSRLTDDGRITLGGRKLVTTERGKRHEQRLADDAAVLAAYRDHFGIELERVPEIRNG